MKKLKIPFYSCSTLPELEKVLRILSTPDFIWGYSYSIPSGLVKIDKTSNLLSLRLKYGVEKLEKATSHSLGCKP